MTPGCCDVVTERGNSGWERCPVCVSDELCWSGESRGVARRAASGPPRQSPPLTPGQRRAERAALIYIWLDSAVQGGVLLDKTAGDSQSARARQPASWSRRRSVGPTGLIVRCGRPAHSAAPPASGLRAAGAPTARPRPRSRRRLAMSRVIRRVLRGDEHQAVVLGEVLEVLYVQRRQRQTPCPAARRDPRVVRRCDFQS